MLKDVIIKSVWQELKKAGASSEEKSEMIPSSYCEVNYEVVKAGDLEFEIRQEEDYNYLFDMIKEDPEVFLVNYHRDFEVKEDEIITEEEVEAIYTGEMKWGKLEKEKNYWMIPLSCLVQSGVWLSLDDSFNCDPDGWDTSHVGLVLVSKKAAKTRKQAFKMAYNLVKTWNKLFSGDVYYIIVKKNGKEIDSISGIIGIEEAYIWVNEYLKDIAKK